MPDEHAPQYKRSNLGQYISFVTNTGPRILLLDSWLALFGITELFTLFFPGMEAHGKGKPYFIEI